MTKYIIVLLLFIAASFIRVLSPKADKVMARLLLTLMFAFIAFIPLFGISALISYVVLGDKNVFFENREICDYSFRKNPDWSFSEMETTPPANGLNGFYIQFDSTRLTEHYNEPVPIVWDEQRQEVVVGADKAYDDICLNACRDEVLVEASQKRFLNDSDYIEDLDIYIIHQGKMTVEKSYKDCKGICGASFFTEKIVDVVKYRDGDDRDEEYLRVDGKSLTLIQKFYLNEVLSLWCALLLSLVIGFFLHNAFIKFIRKREQKRRGKTGES